MKKQKRFSRWDLLPGMLLLFLLPLVAKGQRVAVDLGKYSWFPDGEFQYDFFMYWKSIVFLILGACMLLILIDRCLLRGKKLRNWKYFIPVFGYAVLVILSTILSGDKALSLRGMWQQYESVWVLLGYVAVVFYCGQVVESMKDVRIMLWAAAAGAVIPALIGLTQLSGKDFFHTAVGKGLLTAGLDTAAKNAVEYLYSGKGSSAVYMASYTPNYAGVYIVMILPIAVMLAVTASTKAGKISGTILSIMLMICLYGSGSRTGLIIAGVLLIIGVVFVQTGRKGKKLWIWPGFCILAVLVGIGAYDLSNDHAVFNGIKESVYRGTYDLEAIQPDKNGITIKYKNNTLELIPEMTDMGQMLTAVSNGKDHLTAVWDTESQCFRFEDSVYDQLEFDAYRQEGTGYVIFRQGEITWNFFKEQDSEKYVYLNQYGKADEIRSGKAVLKGYEKAFSGRGYIWGRTIPLLKKYLLWGSGPDTFVAEFPQTDYVMKANTGLGMYQQLPTRAHDLYLQTALQTGVLSAVLLIIFWFRYVSEFIKKSRKSSGDPEKFPEDHRRSLLELGIFLGILGFLLMGIMNDSNLATAPVFWCLLGTGTAMKTFRS